MAQRDVSALSTPQRMVIEFELGASLSESEPTRELGGR